MNELQKTLQRLGVNNFEKENFDADAPVNAPTRIVQEGNGYRQHLGSKAPDNVIQSLKAESVGQLSIGVTRNAANIATPLPFIIFGQNDFASGYITTLQQLMQPVLAFNATTVVAVTSVSGNVVFTYTATGPLTDVVTVSLSGNNTYLGFLSSMAQNFFKFRFCQLTISDENQATLQFGQQVTFGELSSLGKLATDAVVLADLIPSSAFRKDKAELIVPEQPVTPSYSYTSYIVPTASFRYSHGFFMSFRANLNKLG